MSLTVRLDPKIERILNAVARRKRVSRSDVVREALVRYEAGESASAAATPYEQWSDAIGIVELGVRDASKTTGEQFADLLRSGPRARRPR